LCIAADPPQEIPAFAINLLFDVPIHFSWKLGQLDLTSSGRMIAGKKLLIRSQLETPKQHHSRID